MLADEVILTSRGRVILLNVVFKKFTLSVFIVFNKERSSVLWFCFTSLFIIILSSTPLYSNGRPVWACNRLMGYIVTGKSIWTSNQSKVFFMVCICESLRGPWPGSSGCISEFPDVPTISVIKHLRIPDYISSPFFRSELSIVCTKTGLCVWRKITIVCSIQNWRTAGESESVTWSASLSHTASEDIHPNSVLCNPKNKSEKNILSNEK